MKHVSRLLLVLGISHIAVSAKAQDKPDAQRQIDFSVFGAFTSASTGLSAGHNLDVSGGFDLNLPAMSFLRPGLEVRATSPFERTGIDRQQDILTGPRVEFLFGRLHPYADFLIGGGRIDYGDAAQPYGTYNDIQVTGHSTSTVYSPGVGASFDLTSHLAVFADLQAQHWDTPVSLSGHLLAKPLSFGVRYRFGAPGHNRYSAP